ncbi:zinc finger and SCAN domain-containing protein 12-like [Macrobrachium nipponense]|uniref:zinc finger and SCAN domain-containing protein 12-like n=1 Tax=Macrobrachium nipponense TaxID=159736 RepID=UPI0030C7BBC1
MDGVVESFSVEGMHMITEESEEPEHLMTPTVANGTDAISHVIATSKCVPVNTSVNSSIVSTANVKFSELKCKQEQESQIDSSISHIISTPDVPHIIAASEEKGNSTKILDATQILTSESEEIMHEDSKIFAVKFNSDEIIDNETNHIIMATEDAMMDSGGQIMPGDKTHILSSNGEVIAVPSQFLDETGRLHEHVTTEGIEEIDPLSEDPIPIKKEPGVVDAKTSTIQIRVKASAPRKKESPQSSDEKGDAVGGGLLDGLKSSSTQKYTHVDRDDPRSRLHFVKYMKRDGKTIKIWECGICGKEFMHQYTLMRHLPTHTDERNFRCNICGKAFRQMSTLSQHKATHSESRPYVCDLCKKTFSRVSTLISHKKTHTEDKQHQCHICGKAFHQKGNLKNHLFTHTNERPYKCDICGRGFNQASNLQCHKAKSHTDGSVSFPNTTEKYKCNYCDSAFSRRAQLRQHEEYKHGVRGIHGAKILPDNGPRMLGNNSLFKKRKIGNVRIIQLPNGDKTFQEISGNESFMKQKKIKQKPNIKSGILIEPIDTKAMHRALAAGRTPFALLKPSKGVPVVVKVQFAYGSKHMLVPATASELRAAGKFTVSSQQSGTKAVQIKVPVVATVIQRIAPDGQVHMDVEAPAEEEDSLDSMGLPIDSTVTDKVSTPTSVVNASEHSLRVGARLVMNPDVVRPSITEPVMEGEDDDHSVDSPMATGDDSIIIGAVGGGESMSYAIDQDAAIAAGTSDGSEGINSVDLLATAVNLVSQAHISKDIDGIQYLRQMNMGEYEVVPPDHGQATHIMNEHGHIEQIKMVDEANTVTMEQANITALMDALQSAGYHIGTGNQQIIINADGQAMVVDQQQVQMVIDGDMEGVISCDGVVTDVVDPSSVNLVVHEVPEGIHPNDGDEES